MAEYEQPVPETSVLAVASHVVSGNVGNKIAVFVLQSLGCEVAALNTVQFSNHTGYGQFKGTRVSASEISDLWDGLKQSYLADFDMMLSGYIPGAAGVEAVGKIARELIDKTNKEKGPGKFFWVLDPVMGDNGNLYVAPEVVPAYRGLLEYADLILPNQFEAELLSETPITSLSSLTTAIETLHQRYGVPHVIITSVSLASSDHPPKTLAVVGSTMTSDRRARPFKIVFPSIDTYFSGTGDMFAALMVARMREAVSAHDSHLGTTTANSESSSGEEVEEKEEQRARKKQKRLLLRLSNQPSWRSPDDVDAPDLPLAQAAEKVLDSMHEVLLRTREAMSGELDRRKATLAEGQKADDKTMHLWVNKAAELRLVRNLECLRRPKKKFKAVKM